MSAVPVPAATSAAASRGNRNRYRRRGPAPNASRQPGVQISHDQIPISETVLSLRPASLAPSPAHQGSGGRRGRNSGNSGRRGRHGSRGRGGLTVLPTTNGRTFGGNLTVPGSEEAHDTTMDVLQGDAPVFRPGQPLTSRSIHVHKHNRSRRMSKSQAPDIATRTHEDIANGLYECPICTSEVMNNSKIWSCKTCWSVFHMSCIKKWAKNEGSTQQRAPDPTGDIPPPRQWRCPGCNLPKDEMPTNYTCWCSKEVDPRSIPGLPPHSCGQTCSKPRAPRRCEHPCELLCHAGPCPPCPHMGPAQACFCGKEVSEKRCLDTNYEGWNCNTGCGDVMPCGVHQCKKLCHEGLCGSCEETVDSICFCGKERLDLVCCERDDPKTSTLPATDTGTGIREWEGSFACAVPCGRIYDCGIHSCDKECHPQILGDTHCPSSPDVVDHCPCGKTSLEALGCHRISCEDPIKHCSKQCAHSLRCGHLCKEQCHKGDCPPCLELVDIKCRCGRTSDIGTCLEAQGEAPECERTCRISRNCGRHECGQLCCSAEKAAIVRQSKRKARSAIQRNPVEDFEAEHICTRVCGRQLKCGDESHTCQELCHGGPCGTCREAIFDEIACNCGRTVLQPPLPCGTKPPVCQFQCNRQKTCGHPQIHHQCHQEDSQCPKCPYLVQKPCMCGKSQLKNQPCWFLQVNCGQICGTKLKCGTHRCTKTCHRPGECEDANSVACPHICGQPRVLSGCGHPDLVDRCHAPYPCKEEKPCQAKIYITCECQNQKKEVKCGASKTEEGNSAKSLPCDDECLRLQRNAKLAAALNISSDHLDDHVPYSTTTLDMFKDHVKWSQIQEREFRVFAADELEKRLRFKPMSASQRAFLHSLAEDFGLDSESADPEPHRHVVIFKSPRFVSAPMKTLSQCLKIRAAPVEVAPTRVAVPIEPFNALLLTTPRFALTIDELRSAIQQDILSVGNPTLTISFLPTEEIVLASESASSTTESTIVRLKSHVQKTILNGHLATAVYLCAVDSSLNVTRKEEDKAAGGWSHVVKGVPAKTKVVDRGLGQRNTYTVLGKAIGAKGKKTVVENTVDDWERDVDGWE